MSESVTRGGNALTSMGMWVYSPHPPQGKLQFIRHPTSASDTIGSQYVVALPSTLDDRPHAPRTGGSCVTMQIGRRTYELLSRPARFRRSRSRLLHRLSAKKRSRIGGYRGHGPRCCDRRRAATGSASCDGPSARDPEHRNRFFVLRRIPRFTGARLLIDGEVANQGEAWKMKPI